MALSDLAGWNKENESENDKEQIVFQGLLEESALKKRVGKTQSELEERIKRLKEYVEELREWPYNDPDYDDVVGGGWPPCCACQHNEDFRRISESQSSAEKELKRLEERLEHLNKHMNEMYGESEND